jgi:glutathione peroxidase
MNHRLAAFFVAFLALSAIVLGASSVYEFTMNSIDGKPVSLASYKGKVLMVVNVASRCGYTPQYAALEAVYEKYRDRGLVIAGFPANNFGGQEPGTNEEIRLFCSAKYNVKFPMFAKISVAGDDQAPLYRYLTAARGGEIEWNFTKFVIDREGKIARRFPSEVTPDSPEVSAVIESALGK